MRDERVIEQAYYIAEMADRLKDRVESREKLRSCLGNCPGYGYGEDASNCATNLDRMITQLRVELLELRKML